MFFLESSNCMSHSHFRFNKARFSISPNKPVFLRSIQLPKLEVWEWTGFLYSPSPVFYHLPNLSPFPAHLSCLISLDSLLKLLKKIPLGRLGHCFPYALSIPCTLKNSLFVCLCNSIGLTKGSSHTCGLSDLYIEHST